ncbi:hypothetical protein PG991_010328 [Apiospora marii]|uniref:Secreted protein n=1 Tax=Apiospora marii TaxID=335849 RepID=A0ABR1RIL0_9PEZI
MIIIYIALLHLVQLPRLLHHHHRPQRPGLARLSRWLPRQAAPRKVQQRLLRLGRDGHAILPARRLGKPDEPRRSADHGNLRVDEV